MLSHFVRFCAPEHASIICYGQSAICVSETKTRLIQSKNEKIYSMLRSIEFSYQHERVNMNGLAWQALPHTG